LKIFNADNIETLLYFILRTVFWIEEQTKIIGSSMDDGRIRNVLVEGGTKSGLVFRIKDNRCDSFHEIIVKILY